MERNKKAQNVMQTFTHSIYHTPNGSSTNTECVKKGLRTHYTDFCWIKHPELQAKYVFSQIRPCGSQRNFREGFPTQETVVRAEPISETDI